MNLGKPLIFRNPTRKMDDDEDNREGASPKEARVSITDESRGTEPSTREDGSAACILKVAARQFRRRETVS